MTRRTSHIGERERGFAKVHHPTALGHPEYHIEGFGPLLLLIAGLDGTGELLLKQSSALARTYRVVTFRLRDGHQFTYDDLSDDVAAIIRHLGDRRATILGDSFGGTVALNFALSYPQMVEQLVVINSFPRFRKRFKIKLAKVFGSGLPFRLIWPLRRAGNMLGLLVDGVTSEDRHLFWKAIRGVSPDAYARRLQLIAEFDVENRLSEIQAPTLFIAGDRDLLIPSVKEAHAMAARMPNATVYVIKGAGHACLMGDRVRLAELLADHLAGRRHDEPSS